MPRVTVPAPCDPRGGAPSDPAPGGGSGPDRLAVRSQRKLLLPHTPEQVWSAISTVDRFSLWWPWVKDVESTGGLRVGARWTCVVHPPLPYHVHVAVLLTDVVAPSVVRAEVTGDVIGQARVALDPRAEGCEVELQSSLAPASRLLAEMTRWLGPVARYGHDWVLDTAARQFAERAF